MTTKTTTETDAPHGEKTIRLTITLFTDNLPGGRRPKVAQPVGYVTVVNNEWHGLKRSSHGGGFFRSLDELSGAVRDLCKRHGVSLVD